MFPEDDREFEDVTIDRVERNADGTFTIGHSGGWMLWCGKGCAVKPHAGQAARMYGGGIGSAVRGLFIDGKRIWYRTAAEDKGDREAQLYGADIADWLARWDRGDTVWSISMGGLGPGYEQCIQIIAAEMVRWLVRSAPAPSLWDDRDARKAALDQMEVAIDALPLIQNLGCSGGAMGAALNLAICLYRQGPRAVMNDTRVKDRHIQVSRVFPGMAAE